jgi:adenine-specific DNA-methyltransferase
MKTENSTAAPLLHSLDREHLIQMVEELREEKRMREAFSHISETGSNDAALMWQGRNRFLAENVAPVSIKRVDEKSYPVNVGGEHRIIDGDNLAVMRSLLTEFRGGPKTGFDVIYIDPPYNTGKDTFLYNDNYRFSKSEVERLKNAIGRVEKGVSLDDPSRHTKWINHIAPRLWAARKLLKHTGVLIVSIDEHELPRMWMLLEEMYGEKNRLATLIWERSRKNDASYISEGHEYILLWGRDKAALDEKKKRYGATEEWKASKGRWRKRKDGAEEILTAYAEAKLEHGDNLKKIQEAMNAYFKALPKGHPAKRNRFKKVDARGLYRSDGNISWPGGGGPRYDVLHPKTKKPCTVPSRGWGLANPADMQKLIDDGRIHFGKDEKKIPSLITYLHEQEMDVQKSVILRDGQSSVQLLEKLMDKKAFDNPKDHELLAELFNLVTWRDPTALIFDPYAGSGTTGHTVLAMNAEDDGNRRFILVENGDPTNKKIPRDEYTNCLTAERVRRVLSGQWADGKEHPTLRGGFTFYEAKKSVNRKMLMDSTRENLADIILQIIEEDSNRIDCRMDGYQYLIGRTRLGFGIALVWEKGKTGGHQALTRDIRSKIMEEARAAQVTKPVYIYAVANVAPLNDELYRFQQIPDSILARLNLLEEEEEN